MDARFVGLENTRIEHRSRLRNAVVEMLRQAEIKQFRDIVPAAANRGKDVGRLDVAVDEALLVRFGQCVASLADQVNGPGRR